MIVVQDRISVAADRLDAIKQLFENYKTEAAARGLVFVEALVSPPLKTAAAPLTLWLRWRVADTPAWWGMRAQSFCHSVAAIWQQVDALCMARDRTYMLESGQALPVGEDISGFEVAVRSYRETAQLSLREGLSTDERDRFVSSLESAAAELPGIELAQLCANMAPEYAAGDYTWDLLYPDAATAEAARASAVWKDRIAPALEQYCNICHALGMVTISAGLRRPGMVSAIKRTAFFRMLPGTRERTAAFEADLLEMPAHIPQILNWRLSHARPLPWNTARCAPWSYVWEQEFAALDDLLGPYMMHPHHWAHVDRWFDPESGVQGVDTDLSHAFCAVAHSVLSRESAAPKS